MQTENAPQTAESALRIAPAGNAALRAIDTPLLPQEIVEQLRVASRRGRLAGFDPKPPGGGLFAAVAHGHPFDSLLIGDYQSAGGGGGRLTFRLLLQPKLPLSFAAILLLTIWPGVYFTDEVVAQLLPSLWRPWVTYYWYLPLTVLPMPWMWKTIMRRSRRATQEHASEAIKGIAKEIGGTLV